MIKIGCSTLFFWEYPIEEIADIFQDLGLRCMEFFPENPDFWKKRDSLDYVNSLKDVLSKFCLTVHAPYIELNPSSINPYIQKASIMETLWAIELANLYGAKYLTIHPGKRPTSRAPTEDEYIKFYEYLDISLKYAEEKNIILCLENPRKKVNNICYSVEEMKSVLEKFNSKNLKMTLDFAHVRENSSNFVDELHEQIKNVHISGVIYNKDHYPLRYSMVDFSEPLKKLVHEYGYKNCINLELNDLNYNKELSNQPFKKRLNRKRWPTLESKTFLKARDEKISEVIKEIEYLEELIGK